MGRRDDGTKGRRDEGTTGRRDEGMKGRMCELVLSKTNVRGDDILCYWK